MAMFTSYFELSVNFNIENKKEKFTELCKVSPYININNWTNKEVYLHLLCRCSPGQSLADILKGKAHNSN